MLISCLGLSPHHFCRTITWSDWLTKIIQGRKKSSSRCRALGVRPVDTPIWFCYCFNSWKRGQQHLMAICSNLPHLIPWLLATAFHCRQSWFSTHKHVVHGMLLWLELTSTTLWATARLSILPWTIIGGKFPEKCLGSWKSILHNMFLFISRLLQQHFRGCPAWFLLVVNLLIRAFEEQTYWFHFFGSKKARGHDHQRQLAQKSTCFKETIDDI